MWKWISKAELKAELLKQQASTEKIEPVKMPANILNVPKIVLEPPEQLRIQ